MTILTTTSKTTAKALAAICLASRLLVPAAHAQVCGDVTGDNTITAGDAQRVLKAAVGQPVDLVCTDHCAALETRLAALEALLANVTIDGDNLVLTGMNFQVVSGSGTTNGTVNGTGNIIIGYNESNSSKDKRTGSHDLVIGRYQSYSSYGGIVAGEDNEVSTAIASVLGGALNKASGLGAVVVGGQKNLADGVSSVVVTGESNRSAGRSSTVSGGTGNVCTGEGASISGGSSKTLNSSLGWQGGSLTSF